MTILLHRSCYRIINQSSIPTLLKYVQKGQGSTNANTQAFAENALTLLTAISKHSPALYQSHMSELTKALADEKKSTLVEVGIQALANVIRWDPKLAMIDRFVPPQKKSILFDCVVNLGFRKTTDRIVKLTLGSDWRQAKFAARYLAFSKNKAELCAEIIDVSPSLFAPSHFTGTINPIGNIR